MFSKLPCRVCGYILDEPPWGEDDQIPTFDLCNCCGVQFGYEDCNLAYVKKFRMEWIKNGVKWFFSKNKPENWSLEEQLKSIPLEYRG